MKPSKKRPKKADKSLQSIDKSNFPVSSNKTPFASWKQFQLTPAHMRSWLMQYQNQATVSIIAGRVSKNIESIDIDVKNDCNNCLTNNGSMQ
jgi:hypothetical protein